MQTPPPVARDLTPLHGRSVLVRSKRDQRNPETAVRGTLEVVADETGSRWVQVALEFPQMFTTRAHHRTIVLSPGEVQQLLAVIDDRTGALQIERDEPLDSLAAEGSARRGGGVSP